MAFHKIALNDVLAMLIGVSVGIGMAWRGWSYWSLVGMNIATTVSAAVFAWLQCSWRPGPPSRLGEVREMLNFGVNVSGYQLANYFTRNSDNVLIGWYWGAASLGLYSKAYELMMLPIRQAYVPISSGVFAALCRQQDSPDEYRRTFCAFISVLAWVTFPATLVFAVCSEDLILILLGGQVAGLCSDLSKPCHRQCLSSGRQCRRTVVPVDESYPPVVSLGSDRRSDHVWRVCDRTSPRSGWRFLCVCFGLHVRDRPR